MKKNYDIDWDSLPLGQVSDAQIAKQLGCTHSWVGVQRVKRGIAPHRLGNRQHTSHSCDECGQMERAYKFRGKFVCAACLLRDDESLPRSDGWSRTVSVFDTPHSTK